ncbi:MULTISPECIES: hypothetical protein [unclassified Streptomyces]|uniref:hypothetical protein n=1 Tax=unclassified Streptomyces TaxID=2593676 RepID=UPI00037F8E20|nr:MULTISPECIES: hypothetical protein [unclassified Streptomyces]MYX38366.1 hypothetical protein [Streptomyces sp. SID8377]
MTTRHFACATALAAAAAAAVLTGCTDGDPTSVVLPTAAAPSIPAPTSIPYELYTHCGIDEARIGSTYFEAETPLSDGSFNPPPGWDNPTQHGTMTLVSPTEAVFTDPKGHEVRFRARKGAHDFKRVCE